MSTETPTLVSIPLERLRALEALEAQLPVLIEKTKAERDRERLTVLHDKAKANPQEHSKKQLEKYHKNKEEINARRREAYRLKKETEANAKSSAEAGTPA
jgi:hypothetical protein